MKPRIDSATNVLLLVAATSTVVVTSFVVIAPQPALPTFARSSQTGPTISRTTGTASAKPSTSKRFLTLFSHGNDKEEEDAQPKLGISIGSQLPPLRAEELDELKNQCQSIIDNAVDKGLVDMSKLHEKWGRDIYDKNLLLEQAMTLNGLKESKEFNLRVDGMVGEFLNTTSESRNLVHMLAWQDQQRIKQKEREEQEKKQRKANKGKTYKAEPWGKTNKAWDEWDDSDWW